MVAHLTEPCFTFPGRQCFLSPPIHVSPEVILIKAITHGHSKFEICHLIEVTVMLTHSDCIATYGIDIHVYKDTAFNFAL